MNPEVPRLTIFCAYPLQSANSSLCKKRTFSSAFFIRKNNTNIAERHCERTVAIAAPRTPNPNRNINTGSNIRFVNAPIATESIPIREYPCALINGFIPIAIIDGKVPVRYIIIYGYA